MYKYKVTEQSVLMEVGEKGFEEGNGENEKDPNSARGADGARNTNWV